MFLELVFWVFVIYLIYKIVFELLIPASNITAQMKDKMRQMQNMQQHMQEQMKQKQQQNTTQTKSSAPPPSKEDYIDFEEINK
jgi:hypothetical protein